MDANVPSGTPLRGVFVGTSVFVALFPVEDGALLVASDAIRHIGTDGTTTIVWASARDITAAAYDGTLLGIADKAILTTLDRTFATVSTVQLPQNCDAAIIGNGERFICNPAGYDHVFYVFDMKTGTLLSASKPGVYEGSPMHGIAGKDDFITVPQGNQFELHRLTSAGSVEDIGLSSLFDPTAISDVFAVVGNPGTHVLTLDGLLLKIYHDKDDAGPYASPFFKDGTLGTLRDSQSFAALDSANDQVFSLVVARSYDVPLCGSGCFLQHIDATKHVVVSSRVYPLDGQKVLGFRNDADSSHAWVVMSPPGVDTTSPTTVGFVVYRLDY